MDLTKINKITRAELFLPTMKMKDLKESVRYEVTGIRKVQTKFGIKIVIDIANTCSVFLPNRVSTSLEDETLFEQVKNMCDKKNCACIIWLENLTKWNLKKLILKFK